MTAYQPELPTLAAMLGKAERKLGAARHTMVAGFVEEALSLAYYAVFHAVSAVLASQGLTYSSHAQVLGAFNREFVKTGLFSPDATRKIHRLFKDRQAADYDVTLVSGQTAVNQNLSDAETLVRECRAYLEKKNGQQLSVPG